MISAFPYLLSFATISPLILRVAAGIYMLIFAHENLENKREERLHLFNEARLRPAKWFLYFMSAIEIAGGVLLVAGAWTQIAALSLAVLMLMAIIIKIFRPDLISRSVNTYILLFVILISLIFTGAGFAGADLPL